MWWPFLLDLYVSAANNRFIAVRTLNNSDLQTTPQIHPDRAPYDHACKALVGAAQLMQRYCSFWIYFHSIWRNLTSLSWPSTYLIARVDFPKPVFPFLTLQSEPTTGFAVKCSVSIYLFSGIWASLRISGPRVCLESTSSALTTISLKFRRVFVFI